MPGPCLNCKGKAAKGRRCCWKCITSKKRLNNPTRAAYDNLRNSAKERGIIFTISYDYFCEFAGRTDYLAKKGIHKESWHVDRIKDERGYVPGNLQVLTNADNAAKENTYRRWLKQRTYLAEAGFISLLPDFVQNTFSFNGSIQYDEQEKRLYTNVSKPNPIISKAPF